MQFRLFKMGIESKVAVVNLTLLGCALVVMFGALCRWTDEPWLAVAGLAYIATAILTFPVGWLVLLGISGPSVLVFALGAIFFPLNAYLWGSVVAAIIRLHRTRRARRTNVERDSSSL